MIEEARDNLLAGASESLSSGYWEIARGTCSANTTASPKGIVNADTFVEDTATGQHYIRKILTKAASAITYTLSIYAKKAGRDWFVLRFYDGAAATAAYFDLNSVVVGSIVNGNSTNVTSTISAAGNGFYRVTMTFTTNTSTTLWAQFVTSSADGANLDTVVGINAAAVYLWGAQLEVGAWASTLIPESTTTRPYDAQTYNTFASNASATVGTAYAETKTEWTTAGGVYPLVSFGTATLYPLYSNSEASTVIRTNDGTNNAGKTGISDMSTAMRKVASSWTGSVLAVTGAGAAAATGTFDGNMGSTAIGIGNPTTGSGVVWNGHIRNVKLYTAAATAAQLALLTT